VFGFWFGFRCSSFEEGIYIAFDGSTKEKMEKEDELDFTVKHIDIVVGKIRAKRFENIIDEKEE
jgi:hypothetical protein